MRFSGLFLCSFAYPYVSVKITLGSNVSIYLASRSIRMGNRKNLQPIHNNGIFKMNRHALRCQISAWNPMEITQKQQQQQYWKVTQRPISFECNICTANAHYFIEQYLQCLVSKVRNWIYRWKHSLKLIQMQSSHKYNVSKHMMNTKKKRRIANAGYSIQFIRKSWVRWLYGEE